MKIEMNAMQGGKAVLAVNKTRKGIENYIGGNIRVRFCTYLKSKNLSSSPNSRDTLLQNRNRSNETNNPRRRFDKNSKIKNQIN